MNFTDDAVQKSPFSFFFFFLLIFHTSATSSPWERRSEATVQELPIPLLRAGTAHLFSGNSLIYCSQNLSRSSVLLNLSGRILAKHSCHVVKRAGHGLCSGQEC